VSPDPRNPALAPGQTVSGYEVLAGMELPHLDGHAWELRHRRTGARHVHISHRVEENGFLLALRTLPEDSTGVAHILEHGVLEGSRSYPVKMFTQLTGRSLFSYINAFTSSDRTVYPFATPDAGDWDRLLVRYLDAVFHPLLEDEAFLQEGWRLEPADPQRPDGALEIRGVVFNEMKAALASPDAQFSRRFRRELLPDLCYAHESGGDPEAIPDLDAEGWRAFHRRHYRPANSWTVTFGHLPLAPTLARLDEAFAGLEAGTALELPPHPPLGAPQRRVAGYTAPAEAAGLPRYAGVGWRLSPQTDLLESLRLSFLFEVLCGGLAAPLNHGLLRAGLGPSLAPLGFDGGGTRLTFAIGLRGVEEGAGAAVEAAVLDILGRLAQEGLESGDVAAALDRFELEIREQGRSGGLPWGLGLAWSGLAHWMAGGSCLEALRTDRLLETLRREAEDTGLLPGLIRRWLLDNPERLVLEAYPEAGSLEAREERLRVRVEETGRRLGPQGRRALVEQAARVAAWREDPGDLTCMPEVDPATLSRTAKPCGGNERELAGGLLRSHRETVNGLTHVNLALPLDPADPDLPLVDLLGWLPRLGHGGLGVEAAERRLRGLLAGLSLGSHHSLPAGTAGFLGSAGVHVLQLRFHGLGRRWRDWQALLEDLLERPALDDGGRLGELLAMRQSRLRGQVVAGATQIALQTAQDLISPIGQVQHQVEGVGFLRRLQRLDVERDALGARLSGLLERALSTHGRLLSLCAGEGELEAAEAALAGWLDGRPAPRRVEAPCAGPATGPAAALLACTAPVDGAFPAESWPAPPLDHPDAPRLVLLSAWMHQPLYERIRAAGGAYGAQAAYDWSQRTFSFLSWRDPRIAGTYADFDAVRRLALDGAAAGEELRRARVEALRRQDTPLLPHERAARCFQHRLHGTTQEVRDAFRAGLLDATPAQLAEAAGRWLGDEAARRRVVVCAPAHLGVRTGDLDIVAEEVLPS